MSISFIMLDDSFDEKLMNFLLSGSGYSQLDFTSGRIGQSKPHRNYRETKLINFEGN